MAEFLSTLVAGISVGILIGLFVSMRRFNQNNILMKLLGPILQEKQKPDSKKSPGSDNESENDDEVRI